jgi:hypothetical protein
METILSHEGTKTRRGEEVGQKEKEDLVFFGQDEQEGEDFFSYPVYPVFLLYCYPVILLFCYPVNPVNPVQRTNFLNLSYTQSLRFSAALREYRAAGDIGHFFHAELSQLVLRPADTQISPLFAVSQL